MPISENPILLYITRYARVRVGFSNYKVQQRWSASQVCHHFNEHVLLVSLKQANFQTSL